MIFNPQNRASEALLPGVGDRSGEPNETILDALDMADVGDIEIEFERPVSDPGSTEFD